MLRCPWAQGDPLLERYHDEEWGVPLHDDARQFEFLVLETFQAGLSWRLVLSKREAFRRAFADFDPEAVAAFGPDDVQRLCRDAAIVRNRRKIEAAVRNARAFQAVREACGSFDAYAWSFVDGAPQQPRPETVADVPATTDTARAWAADLKRRDFAFVGPTVVYAHMQASGMVNDHLTSCPRHEEVARLG